MSVVEGAGPIVGNRDFRHRNLQWHRSTLIRCVNQPGDGELPSVTKAIGTCGLFWEGANKLLVHVTIINQLIVLQ